MTQGCMFIAFSPISLLLSFPFFFSCYKLITLPSCCWVCLYFSSFLFAAINSYIGWSSLAFYLMENSGAWELYFFTSQLGKCWGTENFLCLNITSCMYKQTMHIYRFSINLRLNLLYFISWREISTTHRTFIGCWYVYKSIQKLLLSSLYNVADR